MFGLDAGSCVPFVSSFYPLFKFNEKNVENFGKRITLQLMDGGTEYVQFAIADLEFSMRLVHSLAVDFCTWNCWGAIFETSPARTW